MRNSPQSGKALAAKALRRRNVAEVVMHLERGFLGDAGATLDDGMLHWWHLPRRRCWQPIRIRQANLGWGGEGPDYSLVVGVLSPRQPAS